MAELLKSFQVSVDLEATLKKKDYLKTQEFLFNELALLEEKRNSALFLAIPKFVRKNTQEREELRENYQKISEQSNELIKIMKKKNSGLHSQIRALEVMKIQEKYSDLTKRLEEAESIIKVRTQEMKNQVESLVSHQRTCEIELKERKQENLKMNCKEPEEVAEINQAFSAKIKEVAEEIDSAYAEVDKLSSIQKRMKNNW